MEPQHGHGARKMVHRTLNKGCIQRHKIRSEWIRKHAPVVLQEERLGPKRHTNKINVGDTGTARCRPTIKPIRSTEPVTTLILAKSRGFPKKLDNKEASTLVNVRIQSLAFALPSKT